MGTLRFSRGGEREEKERRGKKKRDVREDRPPRRKKGKSEKYVSLVCPYWDCELTAKRGE